MYMGLIVISVLFGVIGWLISSRLKSKFATYSKVPLQTGMSGREVAARMLDFYNIHDVKIVQGEGMLTDHYNPQTKTVSLSPEVYNEVVGSYKTPLVGLMEIGLVAAVLFHAFNGVRIRASASPSGDPSVR